MGKASLQYAANSDPPSRNAAEWQARLARVLVSRALSEQPGRLRIAPERGWRSGRAFNAQCGM